MSGRLVILAGGVSSRMKNSIDDADKLSPRLSEESNSKSKAMLSVGEGDRPFLDYLLFNALKSGYDDITIVIGEKDNSVKEYYESIETGYLSELSISFALQPIPEGRIKPLGTADALLRALLKRNDWKKKQLTVCNSDNLYSQKSLKLMLEADCSNAMIEYNREGLLFEKERIEKFAVIKIDNEGFLIDIIEKPSDSQIRVLNDENGLVGVSMNIFKLDYDMILPYLENEPLHPERNEKELPSAIKRMVEDHPQSLKTIPLKENVPDLTSKKDILKVKEFIEKEFKGISF